MKKSILIVALVLCSTFVAMAQPRAIGINLGPWTSFSYEHGFGTDNMLDVAANVILPFGNGFGAGGHVTYDWIDPFGATFPWNEKGEWHWYMGVGGSAGYVWEKNANNWFYAGVAGHIGFEYDFWFPFQLSLDWRPSVGICNAGNKVGFNNAGIWGPISLGVRYLFN
ncbi:MAG: hypothetical protein K5660_04320 [Paludibacteraceae bacterium]|nr:hypothetical protein [Paludibacteraceae bacterium]